MSERYHKLNYNNYINNSLRIISINYLIQLQQVADGYTIEYEFNHIQNIVSS